MIVAVHLLIAMGIRLPVKFLITCYDWCILVYSLVKCCIESLLLYT